jgi:F-type H+-transporting ATPase subunit b
VLSAVVQLQGYATQFLAHAVGEEELSEDPGPIIPEFKELIWAFGSFVVLALLMRFWLFPKLKKGMDARYHSIEQGHTDAETERDAAKAELADYEAQLAAVKAEATTRLEAAREVVEGERQALLAEFNARLAGRRAVAVAEVDAAKAAVRPQIHVAVSQVASRVGELATGRAPSTDVVDRVVREVMAR